MPRNGPAICAAMLASFSTCDDLREVIRACIRGADALVAGVENLAVPLYSAAVQFIDSVVRGGANASDAVAAVLADSSQG